jgi:hypothetical protein
MNDEIYLDINGTPHPINVDGALASLNEEQLPLDEKEFLAHRIGGIYFVLSSSDGDLYNPQNSSMSRGKVDHEKGGLFFRLRKCNKTCFDYYVTFLKTKNKTHFTLAQRNF